MASEGFSVRVVKDDMTPDLAKKLKALQNPTPILRAVGTALVARTVLAFRDASLRPATWPAKSGGGDSVLTHKGTLKRSIRIVSVDAKSVMIGTDRKYAAIHQLGGVIRAKPGKALVFTIGGRTIFAKSVTIPARPYFPFTADGRLAPGAVEPVREILQAATDKALGIT